MNNIVAQATEIFITMRTIEEKKVQEFGEAISKLDRNEVFGDLQIPDVITLQAVCPELYKEHPDVEQYKKEFNEWQSVVTAMNNKIAEYNQEALKCLSEAKQQMSSSR